MGTFSLYFWEKPFWKKEERLKYPILGNICIMYIPDILKPVHTLLRGIVPVL